MTTANQTPCYQCSVEQFHDRNVNVIHYCDLHAAAPETAAERDRLYQVVKWLADFMLTSSDGGDAWCAVRNRAGAKEWFESMRTAMTKTAQEGAQPCQT